MGLVISSGLAKLHELDTVYSTEDLYQLVEVVQVDNYNNWLAQQNADDR